MHKKRHQILRTAQGQPSTENEPSHTESICSMINRAASGSDTNRIRLPLLLISW